MPVPSAPETSRAPSVPGAYDQRVGRCATVAVALAFVAGGCGGGDEQAKPRAEGAAVVPAGVPVYVSVDADLDSEQWNALEDVLERFPGEEDLVAALKGELAQEDIDYERDVEPALGPTVELVWLDVENGGANVVALTKPDDESKLRELLRKGDEPSAVGEVSGWTAIAETDATLDRFRAARERDGSLSADERFRRALAELPAEGLARVYVSGEAVPEELRRDPGARDDVPAWLAASFRAVDDGVRVEAAMATRGSDEATNFASAFLERIPDDAFVALVQRGRGDDWISQLRAAPGFTESIEEIERTLGTRLERLAALFRGELAVYVRPGLPIPELTAATAVDDERSALATLDALAANVASREGRRRGTLESDGATVRYVELDRTRVYYAAVDGALLVTTSRAGLRAFGGGGGKLADADEFERAADAAGFESESTQGFLYVDVQRALALLEGLEPLAEEPVVPRDVHENLRPLRSLFMHSTKDGRLYRFTALLRVD